MYKRQATQAARNCIIPHMHMYAIEDVVKQALSLSLIHISGDFKAHIAALRDGLIETEARRLVREMKRHYEPNSPNKTHFMAELSPAFRRLAATQDTDRLFSMLPYKTLSFSKIEGRHGTYALIDKGENRDREIRKPRPSLTDGNFIQPRNVLMEISQIFQTQIMTGIYA